MVSLRALVGAMLVASLFTMPAQAQVYSCGDMELFIRNPDMQMAEDGKFYASGDFFMQFQAIGRDADKIQTFAFSIGLPFAGPEDVCDAPYWASGAYIEAYKADFDPEDGFFIHMSTDGSTTPQTELGVAVHGYDEAGNELARFWSTAVVDNCDGDPAPCSDDAAKKQRNDKTMPWPIILPGDGSKKYVEGFSLEFGEPLAEGGLLVELNGEDITEQLEPWEGRQWDADFYYDYGPRGLFNEATPMCTYQEPSLGGESLQSCVHPGPAFQWNEREMTDADFIRVVAQDLAGNVAKKDIHIGSSVAGGAITDGVPIILLRIDETEIEVEAGQTGIFTFGMENTGGGQAHPFVFADGPANWTLEWEPGHVPVDPGAVEDQELQVTVPSDAEAGVYEVRSRLEYRQGGNDVVLKNFLFVTVTEPAQAAPVDDPEEPAEVEESPMANLLVLAALAVAFGVRRR